VFIKYTQYHETCRLKQNEYCKPFILIASFFEIFSYENLYVYYISDYIIKHINILTDQYGTEWEIQTLWSKSNEERQPGSCGSEAAGWTVSFVSIRDSVEAAINSRGAHTFMYKWCGDRAKYSTWGQLDNKTIDWRAVNTFCKSSRSFCWPVCLRFGFRVAIIFQLT